MKHSFWDDNMKEIRISVALASYNGEKYIRCAGCGILVKNTNGKRRYCKDCADINKKKLDRTRMENFRKVEFAKKEKTLETP